MVRLNLYILFAFCASFIWSQQHYVALTLETWNKHVANGSTTNGSPPVFKGNNNVYNPKKNTTPGSVIYVHPQHGELSTEKLQRFLRETIASIIIKNYYLKGLKLTPAQLEKLVREEFKSSEITGKQVSEKETNELRIEDRTVQKNLNDIITEEVNNVIRLWNKFLMFTNYLPKRLKKFSEYIDEEAKRAAKKAQLYLSDTGDTIISEQQLEDVFISNTANTSTLNHNDVQITADQKAGKNQEKIKTEEIKVNKAKQLIKTLEIDIKQCDAMMNELFTLESILDKSIFNFLQTCSEKEVYIFVIMKKYMRETVARMISRLLKMKFETQLLLEKQKCIVSHKESKPCKQEAYEQEDKHIRYPETFFDKYDENLNYSGSEQKKTEINDYEMFSKDDKHVFILSEKPERTLKKRLDDMKGSGIENEPNTIQDKDINGMDRKEANATQEKKANVRKNEAEEHVNEDMKIVVHAEVEESASDSHKDMKAEKGVGRSIGVNKEENEIVGQSEEMQKEQKDKQNWFKNEEEIQEIKHDEAEKGEGSYDRQVFHYILMYKDLEHCITHLRQKDCAMSKNSTVPCPDIKYIIREVEECFKHLEMANEYVSDEVENILHVYKNVWRDAKAKPDTQDFNRQTLEKILNQLRDTKNSKLRKFVNVLVEDVVFLKTYINNLKNKMYNNDKQLIGNVEHLQKQLTQVEERLMKHRQIIHILNVIYETLSENKIEIYKQVKKPKNYIMKLGIALHEYMELHVDILRQVNTMERIAKVLIYHEELKKKLFDVRKIWKNYCLEKKKLYKKEKYPLFLQFRLNKNILFPPDFNIAMMYVKKLNEMKETMEETTDENRKNYIMNGKNNWNAENMETVESLDSAKGTENAVPAIEGKDNTKKNKNELENIKHIYDRNPNKLVYDSYYFNYIYKYVLKKYEIIASEKEMATNFFVEYRSLDTVIDIISAHVSNLKFFMKEKRKSILKTIKQKKKIRKENAFMVDKVDVIKKLITNITNVEHKIKGKNFFDMFLIEYRHLINIEKENFTYIDNFIKFIKNKKTSISKWKEFLKKHKKETQFDTVTLGYDMLMLDSK